MYRDALAYPFRNSGWIMIVIGAVFAVVLTFASALPRIGLAASVFFGGYFSAFYFDIISSTITGSEQCPDWPSISSFWEDILLPFFRLIGVSILSFLPFIICLFFIDDESNAFWPVLLAALGYAFLYFPMGILGVVNFGGIGAALPHIVFPAIIRCLPGYLVIVAGMFLVSGLLFVADEFAARIPYVGWLLSAAILLYLLMVKARLLGSMYLHYQERLGWE